MMMSNEASQFPEPARLVLMIRLSVAPGNPVPPNRKFQQLINA